jgi:hypothetical protein
MADKQFQVKLVQHEWVTTEVFNSNDTVVFGNTPPANADEAKTKAQAFVDEHKELENVEYRLEVEEVTPDEPEQEAPGETTTTTETQ